MFDKRNPEHVREANRLSSVMVDKVGLSLSTVKLMCVFLSLLPPFILSLLACLLVCLFCLVFSVPPPVFVLNSDYVISSTNSV